MTIAQQDLSDGNYGAVIPITASQMATPKRDATKGVLTALLRMFTLTDQTGAAIGVSGNPLYVTSGGSAASSTATVTTVAANTSSVQLIGANSARLGLLIANPGIQGTIYILLGAGTASSTNFSTEIPPQTSWTPPINFIGAIQGAWSTTATGAQSAVITELTA